MYWKHYDLVTKLNIDFTIDQSLSKKTLFSILRNIYPGK